MSEPQVAKRADPRPAPRDAAARAAALREHGGLDEDGIDEFYVNPSDIPDGWAYEWKRDTVLNQEDPAYQVSLARAGWEPVPADRHPSYMPKGKFDSIRRKGMVLMERPQVIVDEARERELRKARDQVQVKEAQLNSTPDGQFGRDDPRVKPKIKRGYEAPIAIPE